MVDVEYQAVPGQVDIRRELLRGHVVFHLMTNMSKVGRPGSDPFEEVQRLIK